MSVGERIRRRREQLNMTQLQLAELVGVQEATISRYESGKIKELSQKRIASIAKHLKVGPAYLMDWDNDDADGPRPQEDEFVRLFNELDADAKRFIVQSMKGLKAEK